MADRQLVNCMYRVVAGLSEEKKWEGKMGGGKRKKTLDQSLCATGVVYWPNSTHGDLCPFLIMACAKIGARHTRFGTHTSS